MSINFDHYELSQKLGQALKEKAWKLVTAESCTGGQVAEVITAIPGSSEWYERGFVTYSNESKVEMLGIRPSTLQEYGAVSQQTVLQMAEGALRHSLGHVSLAITGVAGPSGGSPDKPIGTVWFAWAIKGQNATAVCKRFEGDRIEIRNQAVKFALEHLLFLLFPTN